LRWSPKSKKRKMNKKPATKRRPNKENSKLRKPKQNSRPSSKKRRWCVRNRRWQKE